MATKARVSSIQIATELWQAGFQPVPVATDRKSPPAGGFTGEKNEWRSLAEWREYCELNENMRSVGVRMPPNVVALDVDMYKASDPGQIWLMLQGDSWPKTVRVSARGFDTPGGHYLYRIPDHIDYRALTGSIPGAGETIRYSHRYSMAPGMWNPDAAAHYEWFDERTGELGVPLADELPVLPDHLIEYLSRVGISRAAVAADNEGLAAQIDDAACWRVKDALARVSWSEGSRHDTANNRVYELMRLQAEGHRGVANALEVLHESFIEQMSTNPRHGETSRDFEQEWRRMLIHIDPEQEPDSCSCELTPLDLSIDFWTARPWLTATHEFAKGRMVSPIALVTVMLAKIIAEVPPEIVLPPIAGHRASLNTYVALVGKPAAGKSAAIGVANEASGIVSHLPHGWAATESKPGSGEGLIKTFAANEKDKDPETGRTTYRLNWFTRQAVMVAEEIGIIESLQDRAGATFAPIIREAWGGSRIGFAYADQLKKIELPGHSYRLCLIAGAQPGVVDFVLNEAEAGTPQRYLWINAEDKEMSALAPIVDPPQSLIVFPRFPHGGLFTEISVPGPIWWDVRFRREAQGRGSDDAPAQHSDVKRLKLAAAFGIADGRLDINDQDWWLAGEIIKHSDMVLGQLREYQRAKFMAREQGRVDLKMRVTENVEQARIDKQARALRETALRHASNPPPGHTDHCTNKCLSKMVRPPAGVLGKEATAYRSTVIERAVALGYLIMREGTSGGATHRKVSTYFAGGT